MLIANKRAKAQNFQNCSEKHLILVVSRSQLNVPVRIRTNYSVNLVPVGHYREFGPIFHFGINIAILADNLPICGQWYAVMGNPGRTKIALPLKNFEVKL